MTKYPPAIQQLVDVFSKLPGLGPKTAARMVFYLLKNTNGLVSEFIKALEGLSKDILKCDICLNYSQKNPCNICSDKSRDAHTICVVATPQDLASVENVGDYKGLYHVLGGVLVPTEGITPDRLNITQLEDRIKNNGITEIIVGLNPDLEGETTTLFLKKILAQYNVKITRLARGLPTGSDIEYADEITLRSAIEGRKEI